MVGGKLLVGKARCKKKMHVKMEFCQAVFREGEGARFELERDHQLGPLWLPQVLNQGLIHQCTCFSHVRAGAFQLLVYETVRVCGQM